MWCNEPSPGVRTLLRQWVRNRAITASRRDGLAMQARSPHHYRRKSMNGTNRLTASRRSVLKKGALITGLSVVGSVTASGTAAAGIGEGRVGHYPPNSINPDDTVKDASPEDNDGVVFGDVSVAEGGGKVGNAFEFDGDSDYVEIDDDESLGVANVTVAAWVKPDGQERFEYLFDGRDHNYWIKEDDETETPNALVA